MCVCVSVFVLKCAYDLVDANKRVDLIRRALDCSTNWAAVLMKKKNKEMVVVGFVRAVSDLSLIATLHDLFVSPDSGCEPVQVLEAMLERVVRYNIIKQWLAMSVYIVSV